MIMPKNMLKITGVAARESTRYAIKGVRFARKGDKVSASATDGRMLLKAEWTEDGDGQADFETILPRKGLASVRFPARTKCIYLDEPTVNGSVTFRALTGECNSVDRDVPSHTVPTDEGTFPDFDGILRDYTYADDDCTVIGVNPKLDDRVARSSRPYSDRR